MIVPIKTQNSFSPLADLVDEPEDSIIVGDYDMSLVGGILWKSPKTKEKILLSRGEN